MHTAPINMNKVDPIIFLVEETHQLLVIWEDFKVHDMCKDTYN